MTLSLILLYALCQLPSEFKVIDGFPDLEEYSTPTGFGILLIEDDDTEANMIMALEILSSLDSLPTGASVDLWVISPQASGYAEISSLAGQLQGFPAVVILVGHCGFLELDPSILSSEIIDSWYSWGDPECRMTGICNFCRRCNPDL